MLSALYSISEVNSLVHSSGYTVEMLEDYNLAIHVYNTWNGIVLAEAEILCCAPIVLST